MAAPVNNATRHIDFLDGIRSCAILFIMGFHLWQQSWMQNLLPENLLQVFGVRSFSLNWMQRTGYMYVDVLLLLSGFCLFLPYARQLTDPTAPPPDRPGRFFRKRLARILPCYYLVLLVYLLFWVRPEMYGSFGAYLQDVIAHLTFTQVFSSATYFGTHFPTTLWTLSVEMQFYLLFPLLARLFQKHPLAVWGSMVLLAEGYILLFVPLPDGSADRMRINQLPAFLGVYANGMLGAYGSCLLQKRRQKKRSVGGTLLCSVLVFLSIGFVFWLFSHGLQYAKDPQRWQVQYRFLFSVCVTVLLLALSGAHRLLQRGFGNRAFRFLSAISYNLYLVHATVLLQLKAWKIPGYPPAPTGATAWPQSAGHDAGVWYLQWQMGYSLWFWVLSILLAVVLTYLVEKPIAKWLLNRKKVAA